MTPLGVRNNNPGNVRDGATKWQGQTGENAGFCVFDTPENGIRCLAKVLLAYQYKHGLRTLRQMIERWAPGVENDIEAYLDHVCHCCSAAPDNPYTLTPSRLMPLVVAIIRHENGTQPYTPQQIQAGIDAAYIE